MRAQFLVALPMRTFAQKMQIEIGEQGRKGIRVRHFAHAAVIPAYTQAIILRL